MASAGNIMMVKKTRIVDKNASHADAQEAREAKAMEIR